MRLDEYECVRLLDYEGLTQEECAARMGIARTTVTAIYMRAAPGAGRGAGARATAVDTRRRGGGVCALRRLRDARLRGRRNAQL